VRKNNINFSTFAERMEKEKNNKEKNKIK